MQNKLISVFSWTLTCAVFHTMRIKVILSLGVHKVWVIKQKMEFPSFELLDVRKWCWLGRPYNMYVSTRTRAL